MRPQDTCPGKWAVGRARLRTGLGEGSALWTQTLGGKTGFWVGVEREGCGMTWERGRTLCRRRPGPLLPLLF